ncbi:hypothetical protein BYT27DRAFT_7123196 [Phlegmacium glaucopus]|nr:hypothetical protein BYT27DRAFT_7123196 [Phlegmacium glaucopus]
MLERFREAVNSEAWDLGPQGQRSENPLTRVDEVVIKTKRESEFEPDMPRQSKRFKPMVDESDPATVDESEDAANVKEEDDEPTIDEDEDTEDELELDDYFVVAKRDKAETDWEDDENNPADDELPTEL